MCGGDSKRCGGCRGVWRVSKRWGNVGVCGGVRCGGCRGVWRGEQEVWGM